MTGVSRRAQTNADIFDTTFIRVCARRKKLRLPALPSLLHEDVGPLDPAARGRPFRRCSSAPLLRGGQSLQASAPRGRWAPSIPRPSYRVQAGAGRRDGDGGRGQAHLGKQDRKGEPVAFDLSISGAGDAGPYKCKAEAFRCAKYSRDFNFSVVEPVTAPELSITLLLLFPGLLVVLLILLVLAWWTQRSCPGASTINSVHMESLPDWTVTNGQNLSLLCVVDISSTSWVKPLRRVLFFKDDVLLRDVSSRESVENVSIAHARVHDSGTYKCTVVLNNKEKTTREYQVSVLGVPRPRVTLDKREAVEGGVVTVNCSVPEEKAPIHFTVEKVELDSKVAKQRREKTSRAQNFVALEFPVEELDHVLFFRCQARILSGIRVETSEAARSELVTVRESFSVPRFHVRPVGTITEGDLLHVACTIQVTPQAREFPEIIIQKDKAIVATSWHSSEAVFTAVAMTEHSGNYTCKVESSRISKVSSVMVNITELFSRPRLEPSSMLLDQGEFLSLLCSVPGAPLANFTIQRGDTVVSQTQNFSTTASAWDSGTYTCTAGIGPVAKRSNAVQVTVCEMLSRPRISHDAGPEVIRGQSVEIHCQSTNGTWPVSYQLRKAGEVLERLTQGSNDPAVFRDSPPTDVEYQCGADNCHSHAEMLSEVLRVRVVVPVDQVQLSILRSEVASGEDLVLRCFVNRASRPITYRFHREGAAGPFHQVTLNDTQAFWHKPQASKEQAGEYYCTAFNRANIARSVPQSKTLTVRVYLAPWMKGLIAMAVIGVLITALIAGAKCYLQRKAKAKQMPVEMSRPAVPLLNSNNEKVSDPNAEANSHYVYSGDVADHGMRPPHDNKEAPHADVEYTEVEVSSARPHPAPGAKGTETVYSEIRKAKPGE
ncbi:platelet endothelial cell adhesion molecule [Carlito syrichta]|uniref:Platelet endothelial cell adhesion molecule n=1 Tax=Carlito syrichta TaxID=1868482 RepID=A0A3Q0E186_CARSF|nr:platelet endothelial cell adhesion molecule [Carlito syrichta]